MLNAEKSNAILVCRLDRRPIRGLRQSRHGETRMVGRGGGTGTGDRHEPIFRRLFKRYHWLHGHHGTERGKSATGRPWGMDLVVTIADMVRAQALLVDFLGMNNSFWSSAAPWAA